MARFWIQRSLGGNFPLEGHRWFVRYPKQYLTLIPSQFIHSTCVDQITRGSNSRQKIPQMIGAICIQFISPK